MSTLPLLLSLRLLSENLSENLHALLDQQKETWVLLRSNYASLDAVNTKEWEYGSSGVRVQHNPARLASTAARVDDASVRKRPCFLCVENLPREQRAVKYNEEFLILCNPFPIFPEHFTVTHIQHVPQSIELALPTLLSLSKDLEDEFVVLYNGPRCGASAPDHLHVQVGNVGFLPLEEQYERLITDAGEKVADRGGLLVFAVDTGLRRFVAIESDEQEEASAACRTLFRELQEFSRDAEEPMMNILSWYKEGEWKVVVFPRAKHRPSVFYDQENGLLVSPAAVDLAGVVITPRAEDFARITTEDVEAIFHEVLISPDAFEQLRDRLVMSYGRNAW